MKSLCLAALCVCTLALLPGCHCKKEEPKVEQTQVPASEVPATPAANPMDQVPAEK